MSRKNQTEQKEDVATTWLHVKVPVDFVERIDRWRANYKAAQGVVMMPSRPAVVRFMVHERLTKDEQRAAKKSSRKAA
jgi:hypothetical protein